MATTIDRDQVQRLMAEGAQLVDVLPVEVHADARLPSAVNLPLTPPREAGVVNLAGDLLYGYLVPRIRSDG